VWYALPEVAPSSMQAAKDVSANSNLFWTFSVMMAVPTFVGAPFPVALYNIETHLYVSILNKRACANNI